MCMTCIICCETNTIDLEEGCKFISQLKQKYANLKKSLKKLAKSYWIKIIDDNIIWQRTRQS